MKLLSALLCLIAATVAQANVIGIDLGSENMKVGLVSPGKFDIGKNWNTELQDHAWIVFISCFHQ